jgi:hypothetical protein
MRRDGQEDATDLPDKPSPIFSARHLDMGDRAESTREIGFSAQATKISFAALYPPYMS